MRSGSPSSILFGLLTAATFVAGCAVREVPAQATPAMPAVPTTWDTRANGVTTNDAVGLATWWELLGDDTLTQLIARTLNANTDLDAARARLREARAQRANAGAALLPRIAAGASASGSKRADVDASGSAGGSIDASWEPDVFGATRASIRAATADAQALEDDLHALQVSLAGEVAATYVEVRSLQARLDIARQNEASQAETLQLTNWRRQAGLASSVDVEQARTSLEQTRAQLPALASAMTQAMHRLDVLAGRPPGSLAGLLTTPVPLPPIPDRIAVGIPADTLRQRPDVRAAEARLAAAAARVSGARADRYPSVALSGSIGTEVIAGALTGGTSVLASLVGQVTQTIFDGGRVARQVDVQRAAQDQLQASYRGIVLTALEDVENALVALEQSRARLLSLEQAQDAARTAAQLARDQYSAGLADFQRVLDTQRTVLSVEDAVVTTSADRVTAVVQLYKALGGGWSPSSTEPKAPTS